MMTEAAFGLAPQALPAALRRQANHDDVSRQVHLSAAGGRRWMSGQHWRRADMPAPATAAAPMPRP